MEIMIAEGSEEVAVYTEDESRTAELDASEDPLEELEGGARSSSHFRLKRIQSPFFKDLCSQLAEISSHLVCFGLLVGDG